MLTTSFNLLKSAGACTSKYHHLAEALGGITKYGKHTPISIEQILDTNGLNDALWALRAVADDQTAERNKLARLCACDCAQDVLPIYERQVPGDSRPRRVIDAARAYALGTGSAEEMAAAWDAARDAEAAAWDAAGDAAGDAEAAAEAAKAAARAAEAAAWAAAWAAAGAAKAAARAAEATAWAADAAARTSQADRLRTALRGDKNGQ